MTRGSQSGSGEARECGLKHHIISILDTVIINVTTIIIIIIIVLSIIITTIIIIVIARCNPWRAATAGISKRPHSLIDWVRAIYHVPKGYIMNVSMRDAPTRARMRQVIAESHHCIANIAWNHCRIVVIDGFSIRCLLNLA
jgi:hypothetical protein